MSSRLNYCHLRPVGADRKRHEAEEVHAVSLASLNQEFAAIIDTEGLLKRLK